MFNELYNAKEGFKLSDGSAYFVSFLTYWCMGLYFLLAGASAWLALRRKTPRQFVQERVQRLLIPLVIGFVILVPLQAYFEWVSNGQYAGTLLEFYPYFLGNILCNGKLSWIISTVHHLWFLSYLFGFSLITLPLCLYLRSEKALAWIERLAVICERPGGPLVPLLPIIVVQVSLHALFPAYCSVTDALCWMLFYMHGYILLASPRLKQALQQQKRLTMGIAITGFIAVLVLGKMGLLHAWMYAPDYSIGCLLLQILSCLTLWASLLVALNIGDKYMNRKSQFITYGSAASFSWYLIHFPIVTIVAYCLLPLHLPALVTFLLISGSAFTITFLSTDLLRRANQTLTRLNAMLPATLAHWLSHQDTNHFARTLPLKRVTTSHLGH